MGQAKTYVHVYAGDRFEVMRYPADTSLPAFVIVDADGVSLSIRLDGLSGLNALIAAAVEARDWLAGEASGQAPLPVESEPVESEPVESEPVESEPVGDTGLSLHVLPVGVA